MNAFHAVTALRPPAGWDEGLFLEQPDVVADEMANGFGRLHPGLAAKAGFRRWQVWSGVGLAATTIAATVLVPTLLALVLIALTTSVSAIICWVSWHGLHRAAGEAGAPALPLASLGDTALPFYTVLVPAYHEEAVIGEAGRCLSALDYPADRLEVLILVEGRDLATQQAIKAAHPAAFVRTVRIPAGKPQTKPRSCNAGLMIARGDLIVIFDAEDRPDPDQLRVAARAFSAADDRLACVQARLEISNPDDSFITRQFALEYLLRYRLMLPGLARLGLPIPLGGTSNHFRTDVLRRMGGWDAWNVTEDADLGMRCRALGYQVRTIDSVTRGEAPAQLTPWVRQRTRWTKGFLLTTLVHTRHPVDTARRFGGSGLLSLYAFVLGAPLMFLSQPLVTGLTLSRYEGFWTPIPGTELIDAATSAVTITCWLSILWSVTPTSRWGTMRTALLLPAYWCMHWVAAWRALAQLIHSPFTWEKTPHGPTTSDGDDPSPATRRAAGVALELPLLQAA